MIRKKRDTKYAREIQSAQDHIGQSIERLFVKGSGQEEIRFSWWREGKMVIRPLDLPEDQLLDLMRDAIHKGVFSAEFLKNLHGVLYDARHCAAEPD